MNTLFHCGCGTTSAPQECGQLVFCTECGMSADSRDTWNSNVMMVRMARLYADLFCHHPRLWTGESTFEHLSGVASRCYVARTAGVAISLREIAAAWLHEESSPAVLGTFPPEVVALVRAMQPTLPASSSRADRHAASLAHFTSHPEVSRIKCFDMRNNLISVRAALRAKHVSRSYATRFAAECVEMARAISTEPFCVDGVLLAAERVC